MPRAALPICICEERFLFRSEVDIIILRCFYYYLVYWKQYDCESYTFVSIATHAARTVCVCRWDSAAVAVYRVVNRTPRPFRFLSFSLIMLQPFDFNGIGTRVGTERPYFRFVRVLWPLAVYYIAISPPPSFHFKQLFSGWYFWESWLYV